MKITIKKRLKKLGIKELTKEQADKLYGFSRRGLYNVLGNGETGYCHETKEVITCCGNDGDYNRINLNWFK